MDASRQVLARWCKKSTMSGARCLCGMLLQKLPNQRITNCVSYQTRHAASFAEQFKTASDSKQKKSIFRTPNDSPLKHTNQDSGLHYTIPSNDVQLVLNKALPAEFKKQVKTFGEACMMVRDPALEVMTYLKQINLDHPVTRFLLYGRRGSGRSMTLAHIMHYCSIDNWILVHAPWPVHWLAPHQEMSQSSHRSGRIDLPVVAAEWLVNFKLQNQRRLGDVITTSSYNWSKREITDAGSPILDVVDFGLNRGKFAADCVGVILKELKKQANEKRLKVLVAVDGVNSFWTQTKLWSDDRVQILAEQVSLVYNFKKMLRSDWTNGAVVCTVDPLANHNTRRESYKPHYLLGKEGFEVMDPFIPVLVPYYSEKEAYSCLEYFLDMNWIQTPAAKTEGGKKELIFLSNKNPHTLTRLCAAR